MTQPANADLASEPRSRGLRWLGRRWVVVTAALAAVVLLGLAGVSYAGYGYSKRYEGRILPGSSIAGVPVGGLTPARALAKVRAAIRPQLTRRITLTWRDRSWSVTPKELGARSDARAAVAAALQASAETSFLEKVGMSVLGHRLGFSRDVAITHPHQGVRGFVKGVASSVDREAEDAFLDYDTGWVEIVPERAGRRLQAGKARRQLMRALRTGGDEVELDVDILEPAVTTAAFGKVLLLHVGDNKLYLYENGEITKSWPVATGQPEYPTPTGLYEITEKRYMPTWVNPDPEGWGADMPLTIPPGPGNPLGTRALNWSAPGIRFHGTSADYSIGYNASHGCVRMHMWHVEELYDLVDVGTPIVSVNFGEMDPLYASSAPDPTPVREDGEAGRGRRAARKAG